VGCGDLDPWDYCSGRIGDDTGQSAAIHLSKTVRYAENGNQHELRQLGHTGSWVLGSNLGEAHEERGLLRTTPFLKIDPLQWQAIPKACVSRVSCANVMHCIPKRLNWLGLVPFPVLNHSRI
jgi:hypothetical protein